MSARRCGTICLRDQGAETHILTRSKLPDPNCAKPGGLNLVNRSDSNLESEVVALLQLLRGSFLRAGLLATDTQTA